MLHEFLARAVRAGLFWRSTCKLIKPTGVMQIKTSEAKEELSHFGTVPPGPACFTENSQFCSLTDWDRKTVKTGAIPVRNVGAKALLFYPNLVRFLQCEDGADNTPAAAAVAPGIRRVDQ